MELPALQAPLDCDLAGQATRAWLAGRALPCERRAWSDHLRGCVECESDLRSRAQLAAATSTPVSDLQSGGRMWRPALSTSKRRALSFVLVCAAMLWLMLRVSRGTRVVDLRGTAAAHDLQGARSERTEFVAGAPLETGTIVVLEAGSRLRLRSGELELRIHGPARVRSDGQRVDLLAGLALVSGSGVLGTSRGELHLSEATELLARESRSGLWLACAEGRARLHGGSSRGAPPTDLESGHELHLDR